MFPIQCSCLENPRDGEAWWAAVYGVTQSRTQLKWLSIAGSSWLCMGIFSLLWAEASHCNGSSCCGVRALGMRASVVAVPELRSCSFRVLEQGLRSCGVWAWWPQGIWDLPGIKRVAGIGRWILNHWTTREVSGQRCFEFTSLLCSVVSFSYLH